MSSQKKISVLMSVYNAEFQVIDAVKSILEQTYKNLDLYVVDDHSTDNTYGILKEFLSEYSNTILLKNNENLGLTKSLNILINESEGELIARQDADDTSNPFRLEKQIQIMEKFDLDACTTRALIQEEKRVIPKLSHYIPKKILIKYKNPFIHGSLVIKRNVMNKVGNYDENFYFSQDYKFFHDFLLNNYKIEVIKEPLYYLNMKDNISTEFKAQQEYYAECVRSNKAPKLY
ncbi:glycosyltransferase family 2 protein [Acidimicrobiaceae bacterium]|jgi:glycosyltransferase EpsE|nr:glycosyltransferase family 2 protein [Acidimicrobiaceae bacterium]